MTPVVGFEPTIAAGEQQLTYAFDRAATEIGSKGHTDRNIKTASLLKQLYEFLLLVGVTEISTAVLFSRRL